MVDEGWFASSDGGQVHMRYASDLPQRLNTLRLALAEARAALAAQPTPTLTHGRHCPCSACAAPCGMHGQSCPNVYAPAHLSNVTAPEPSPDA